MTLFIQTKASNAHIFSTVSLMNGQTNSFSARKLCQKYEWTYVIVADEFQSHVNSVACCLEQLVMVAYSKCAELTGLKSEKYFLYCTQYHSSESKCLLLTSDMLWLLAWLSSNSITFSSGIFLYVCVFDCVLFMCLC